MSRLPSERYLIQQIGGDVVIFAEESFTEPEREIVRVPLFTDDDEVNASGMARAQKVIHDSELDDEDKCFAHFWCGYFYGYATSFSRDDAVALAQWRREGPG